MNPSPSPMSAARTLAVPMARAQARAGERHWMQGRELAQRRDWRGASACYERATRTAPRDGLYWLNLAHARSHLADWGGCESAARRSLALEPDQPLAQQLLGEALLQQHRYADAEAVLRALDAGGHADARSLVRLASALQAQQQHGAACEVLLRALANEPTHVDSYGLLAESLRERGLRREAVECMRTVLALNPTRLDTWIRLSFEKRHLLDWSDLQADTERIAELIRERAGTPQMVASLATLSLPLPPALHLQAAACEALAIAHFAAAEPMPAPSPALRRAGRIRLGWLSFDFRNHPVAQLLVDVIEALDRDRFEVHLYSTGPDDGSPLRRRMQAAGDAFVELRGLSDQQAAERIRADGIDVLVDLGGYTKGQRMGIFARRPAAVQVGFLGFPGTTGARYIDYIVGDPLVTPLENAAHFSECIAQMPLCFQPNDRARPLPQPMSRAAAGLPDDAFVLCAFNNTYKILPAAFDRWCAVLRRVPHAVLWLKQTNGQLHDNVRREAAARGVDPARIVFAPSVRYEDHFSRLALADVFADTWPYNAHTTASDALWAGVPVVTRCGDSYAARVAASVLQAAGLGELAFDDDDDYENALVAIATEPALGGAYRRHLTQRRAELPLWDTPRYTRELGRLFGRMFERWAAALPPAPLPAEACDAVHVLPAL